MTGYRVTFFKTVLSSNGQAFKCPQEVIHVRHARSPERADQAAQRRYERSSRVRDWRLHADLTEVETIEEAEPVKLTPRRRKSRH